MSQFLTEIILIKKDFHRNLKRSINNKYQGTSYVAVPIIFYFWICLRKLSQKEKVIVPWKSSQSLRHLALVSQIEITDQRLDAQIHASERQIQSEDVTSSISSSAHMPSKEADYIVVVLEMRVVLQ